jgi:hypothetical protein
MTQTLYANINKKMEDHSALKRNEYGDMLNMVEP